MQSIVLLYIIDYFYLSSESRASDAVPRKGTGGIWAHGILDFPLREWRKEEGGKKFCPLQNKSWCRHCQAYCIIYSRLIMYYYHLKIYSLFFGKSQSVTFCTFFFLFFLEGERKRNDRRLQIMNAIHIFYFNVLSF